MTVSMRLPLSIASFAIALGVACGAAVAQPPPGPIDPAIHAWFEGLVRADGLHCCGAADCRVADPHEVRTQGDDFEILLNGAWQPVPESMMIHRDNGPFAATIVCKSHTDSGDTSVQDRLYCVVPYAGG